MAVHQYARFCNNLCPLHEHVVRRIAKYLASTPTYVDLPDGNLRLNTRGIVCRNDIEKGIECDVDSNFAGGWDQSDYDNAENFMLRAVYVRMYTACPVLWCSNLETEIALSTT